MSEKRWDVIAAKDQRIQPAMSYDTVPGAAAFIWHHAGELKAPGYKRVIIAGQSWGSCVAMVANQEKDFAAEARADRAKHLDPGAVPTARLTLFFMLNKSKFAELVLVLYRPSVMNTFAQDEWKRRARSFARKAFRRDQDAPPS